MKFSTSISTLSPLFLLLTALPATNALFLCLYQGTISDSAGMSSYEEPACLAQHGNDESDCFKRGVDGALAGVQCSSTITENTNQVGGYWINSHNINYESGGQHWYCNPGDCGSDIGYACGCDAGGGAPARKGRMAMMKD